MITVKPLLIEAFRHKTPEILFDPANCKFSVKGMSSAENPYAFYQDVMDWLAEYKENPCEKTSLVLRLDYFNTASAKCILDMLESFVDVSKTHELHILWHCEEDDEDMVDAITNFSMLIDFPIEIETYPGE